MYQVLNLVVWCAQELEKQPVTLTLLENSQVRAWARWQVKQALVSNCLP